MSGSSDSPPSQGTLLLLLKASNYAIGSWIDESGQGNNANFESGIGLKNSAGNGLVLDGQTSLILPNLGLGNAWTASVWVKHKGGIGTNPSIITQMGGDIGFTMSLFDSGYLGGFYNVNAGWQTGSPISLEYAKWVNVQVTWDGSAITTYINGTLIGAVPIATTSASNGNAFRIGRRWDSADYFVGEIGEVRMYNYPLTQEQVMADYQESVATFPASPPAVLLNQLVLNTSTAEFGTSTFSAMTSGPVSYGNFSGKDGVSIDSMNNEKITIPCVLNNTSSFTVSFWANAPYTEGWVCPLTLNDGINDIFGVAMIGGDNGGVMFSGNFSIGYNSIGFHIPSGFNELADWNNYTITYEYGNFNLYINGTMKGFYNYANTFTSTQITLGANNPYCSWIIGNGNALSYISQLCVYDGLPDITNLVNQTLTNTIFNIPSNPLTPYGLSTSVSSSSLAVNWVGGIGATSYTYTLNGIPLTPSTQESHSATFTGLNTSTEYTVQVTAVSSSGSQSATTTVSTTAIPPTAPVVSITTFDAYSFSVSWTGDRATSYVYKLNSYLYPPATENISDKTATFTGLNSTTTYSLVITALNSGGSADSTEVSVTTLNPPPTAPEGLIFSDVTPYSFMVSWTGGDGAISYTYTLNETPAVPSTDNGLVNKTATFTGLTPNTNYNFVVTAINDFGSASSPTHVPYYTITADPLMPYGLVTTEVGTTSFTVTWLGGIGATSYSYDFVKTPEVPTVTDNGLSSKSATVTGLTPGHVYILVITANSETNSSTSQILQWTLEDTVVATPVLILKASNYTSGVWQDESNNSNNATLENGTALKNTAGNGLVLDGQTSWTFPNLTLGNAWSANVWYKNNSNYAPVLTQLNNDLLAANLTVVETNGILHTGFTNNVTSYDNNMITSTNWTNVQATWNGTFLKTYINGVLSSTNGLENTSVDSGMAYRIGSDGSATPGAFMIGEIGEVRIYNAAISGEQVLADYNESLNTFATAVEGEAPTAVTLTLGDLTGTSLSASWTGGLGAISYSYTLNGSPATPSFDKALTERKVAFTGLVPSTSYTLVVTATNVSGSVSATAVETTLSPPAPVTPALVTALQSSFSSVSTPAAAASAIQAALAQNVAPETLVAAALATASPAMFTALVSSPAFVGRAISIPPTAAAALYAAFSPTVAVNKTLPLNINFPAADGSVKPPTGGANSKLAIDLNRDTYVPFRGATGYGIHVVGGVQYFVTPTNPSGTLVHVGDIIRFTPNGSVELSFTVADLDIVLVPYTPPAVVCFLGSAPVLTPTGYRRIDRIQVGDIVRTPTGTATVEAVKKQAYKPSSYTNPYVIPEGKFGANRKLLISPRHKVAVDGKMVEARDLGLEQEEQKQLIYYNLQITKRQNMIVAGVEVESLAALIRVTISNEAFKNILETRYGGKLTDEIKAKCRFLRHGVSVPVLI